MKETNNLYRNNDFSFLIGRRVILLRIGGELGIKSRRTRNCMIDHLKRNIKKHLDQFRYFQLIIFRDRLIVYSESDANLEALAHLIAKSVSGVSSVSIAFVTESTESKILSSGLDVFISLIQPKSTFSVRTRREGTHPFTSMEIAAKLGAKILDTGIKDLKVDLKNPDYQLFLDIRGPLTFIYTSILKGIDGIPSYSQGIAIALIKPNCNSILAAWLMKKRGVKIQPLFIKTGKSGEIDFFRLANSEFGVPVKTISLTPFLQTFANESSLCLLCQIVCEQISQNIAQKTNINTIISPTCFNFNGEDMSLDALKVLDKRAVFSVLRPLQMGYYGEEFDLSNLEKKPCCSIQNKVSLQVAENFDTIDFDEIYNHIETII
jgi:adenylyl- and sulfurtransferase ThiI